MARRDEPRELNPYTHFGQQVPTKDPHGGEVNPGIMDFSPHPVKINPEDEAIEEEGELGPKDESVMVPARLQPDIPVMVPVSKDDEVKAVPPLAPRVPGGVARGDGKQASSTDPKSGNEEPTV